MGCGFNFSGSDMSAQKIDIQKRTQMQLDEHCINSLPKVRVVVDGARVRRELSLEAAMMTGAFRRIYSYTSVYGKRIGDMTCSEIAGVDIDMITCFKEQGWIESVDIELPRFAVIEAQGDRGGYFEKE